MLLDVRRRACRAHHAARGVDDLADDVDGVNRHAAPDTDDDVRGFVERRSMALLREQPQQILVQTREHRANSGRRAGRQGVTLYPASLVRLCGCERRAGSRMDTAPVPSVGPSRGEEAWMGWPGYGEVCLLDETQWPTCPIWPASLTRSARFRYVLRRGIDRFNDQPMAGDGSGCCTEGSFPSEDRWPSG